MGVFKRNGVPLFPLWRDKKVVEWESTTEVQVLDLTKEELMKIKLVALEKKVRENSGQRYFTQKELEECLIDLIKIVREGL